jgi:hypothetical protein
VDCCAHHNFARAGRSARLFFGKIAGGRDLARSHFLFPVKEKRAVAPGKIAARFCLRFAPGSPQRNHIRSLPARGVTRTIDCKCLTRRENFAGAGAATTLAMALKQLN